MAEGDTLHYCPGVQHVHDRPTMILSQAGMVNPLAIKLLPMTSSQILQAENTETGEVRELARKAAVMLPEFHGSPIEIWEHGTTVGSAREDDWLRVRGLIGT